LSGLLYVFDDARARIWAPFRSTRPIGELLHGCLLLRERWERAIGLSCAGHIAGQELAEFDEEGAPPVVALSEISAEHARTLVSSRAVPPIGSRVPLPEGPATLVVGGEVVGWHLPVGSELPTPEALLTPGSMAEVGTVVEIGGSVLGWPWDLVEANPERIREDAARLQPHGGAFLLTDVHIVGDHAISTGHRVSVESGVTLDVREGPIRLEDRVRVRAPARLTGPVWIGADSTVLGGEIAHSSVGPVSKVRGEVQASVIVGYANKAHDGYLGHALMGRWVNLGAMTTCSDLKNSLSSVRVRLDPERSVDTGHLKVGCFLGDHVKTGIGTMINTGTVVGAGSNVFGGVMPPTYVPPFSWGSGDDLAEYRLEKFLEVAEATMGRRGVVLTASTRELLRRAWEESRPERVGPTAP
jgi:UDP-N-acetylglucosamine diphosphorylase/glucosamine-1-phosphate N-acetyltransferase